MKSCFLFIAFLSVQSGFLGDSCRLWSSVPQHFCCKLPHLCFSANDVCTIRADHYLRLRQPHTEPVVMLFYGSTDLLTNTWEMRDWGRRGGSMCKWGKSCEMRGKSERSGKISVTSQFALLYRDFSLMGGAWEDALLPADWQPHCHARTQTLTQGHILLRRLDSSPKYLK